LVQIHLLYELKKLAANINKNRLFFSIVYSMLAHTVVFLLFNLFLQLQTTIPKENKVNILEVRLTQSSLQKYQTKPILISLDIAEPAQPIISQNVAQKSQNTTTATTLDTRQAGQASEYPPVRTYHPQEKAALANHHSEIQAQLMIQQLQQMLAKRLDVIPLVFGKCVLVESEDDATNKLKCDSSALHEVIYKEQQNVAEALIALRETGRLFNGFSVEIHHEKPIVTLNFGELSGSSSN
jgi:hypothetical protein